MMKKTTPNFRYKDEKDFAQELGMTPVAFSGAVWQSGHEDFYDDDRLGQSKHTERRNAVIISYLDLFQLCQHAHDAQKQFPIFGLEFKTPIVNLKDGEEVELPRERWVCVPLADYKQMYEALLQKILSQNVSENSTEKGG